MKYSYYSRSLPLLEAMASGVPRLAERIAPQLVNGVLVSQWVTWWLCMMTPCLADWAWWRSYSRARMEWPEEIGSNLCLVKSEAVCGTLSWRMKQLYEQLSLTIRWVDNGYVVHEDTLGLIQLRDTKSRTICSGIKDILTSKPSG